jgi:hypothetical protein
MRSALKEGCYGMLLVDGVLFKIDEELFDLDPDIPD